MSSKRASEELIDEPSGQSSPPSVKRRSGGRRPATSVPCQVPGCGEELIDAEAFYRRYRVCKRHSREDAVQLATGLARFCQQCARFHDVSEFDEERRSCRTALAWHRKKRRSSGMRRSKKEGEEQQGEASAGSGEAPLAGEAAADERQQRQQQAERHAPAQAQRGLPGDPQLSALVGSSGGTLGRRSSGATLGGPSSSQDRPAASSTSGSSIDAEAAGRPRHVQAAAAAVAAVPTALPAQLEVAGSASLQGYSSGSLNAAVPGAAALVVPSRTPVASAPRDVLGVLSSMGQPGGMASSPYPEQLRLRPAAPAALPGMLLRQPAAAHAPPGGPAHQPLPAAGPPRLWQHHPMPAGSVPQAFSERGGTDHW
ncbi:hypothetical protein ABPG75_010487 [Micractinium tetrahymenae]